MNCETCKDKKLAQANENGTIYLRCGSCQRPLNETTKKRTGQQNRRLHQWMKELADEFNDRGLSAQQVLKPTWEIQWTMEMVKDNIVAPIANAVAKTEHTSELNTKQLQQVIDTIDKNLLQKFDVDLPFGTED